MKLWFPFLRLVSFLYVCKLCFILKLKTNVLAFGYNDLKMEHNTHPHKQITISHNSQFYYRYMYVLTYIHKVGSIEENVNWKNCHVVLTLSACRETCKTIFLYIHTYIK